MTEICLYIDEDAMDEDFIQALKYRNIDVVTVKDIGMLHRSDEEQLTWAMENSRVVFTFNTRDFYQLHTVWIAAGYSHAGIVCSPQQKYSIGELIRGISLLMNTRSNEEMQNRVEFISSWIR